MTLRDEIARKVTAYMPEMSYGDAIEQARQVADSILALPQIAEALASRPPALGYLEGERMRQLQQPSNPLGRIAPGKTALSHSIKVRDVE